jgi:hypothetical protein
MSAEEKWEFLPSGFWRRIFGNGDQVDGDDRHDESSL